MQTPRTVTVGDVVTVDIELRPENGLVLEPLFDTSGTISFVVGGGNYLPGIHELVEGMRVGQKVTNVAIDSGWGKWDPDLILVVPKSNFKKIKNLDNITVGSTLNLKGGFQVSVLKVDDDTITVDANHPLAGSGYLCDLRVLSFESYPTSKRTFHENLDPAEASHLEVSTWAMGCFWGGELAFMRTPGVVGTRVGYTQGVKVNPTYEEVCEGVTKHREAVLVIFDNTVVTYKELIKVYLDRLSATQKEYRLNIFDDEQDDDTLQYRHGIYYHNAMQRAEAEEATTAQTNKFDIEIRQAAEFYEAEEHHQQYLLKGGQSARKGCKVPIRCFG